MIEKDKLTHKEKESLEIIQNYYAKYKGQIIMTTSCGVTSSLF